MNAAHPIVVHVVPRIVVYSDDLAATVLGALGVVLALAALAWQAYTFFRSGSRIKVIIRTGATDGVNAYVTTAGQMTDNETQLLLQQGMSAPVVGVQVINSGRGPTSVTSVDVAFRNGASLSGAYLPGSEVLPFRLDGETERTWHVDARHVFNAAKAFEQTKPTGKAQEVRGRVHVAGRTKPVYSKNKITIAA